MLAYPPPLTKPQLDGLRFRHPFLDQIPLFCTQLSTNMAQLTSDVLRLVREILTATQYALAYRIGQGVTSVHELTYLMQQKRLVTETNVTCGLQIPIAGEGYTVSISQSALTALEIIVSWDPILQPSPSFDVLSRTQQLYDGIAVTQGGTQTPIVQKQIDYLYRIRQLDSLPNIAAKLTGNAANSQSIAAYNQLREPYISDNPQDQYGNKLAQGTLTSTLNAGSNSVTITGVNAQVVTQGTLLYLQTLGSTGLVYETVPISSFDGATSTVTLDTNTVNVYPQGATWIIFPVPMDVTTKVLQIGDALHIPGNLLLAQNQVTNSSDFLGTDIALTNGQVTFQNGDLQTVTGGANLQQALQNRFQTPVGALPYHSPYGSKLLLIMGEVSQPHFTTLAKLYVRETVMQDPRIADLISSTVQKVGNGTQIAAQVKINNSNEVLSMGVVT